MYKKEVIITVKACTKKSSDFVDISIDIVAKVIYAIFKPLTHICNISFTTGVFPSIMKNAKVMPLFKNGAKTDLTNHRSIYLLPQFSSLGKRQIKFESVRVPYKYVHVTTK